MRKEGHSLNIKVFNKYITVNEDYLKKIFSNEGKIVEKNSKFVLQKKFGEDTEINLKEISLQIEKMEEKNNLSEDFYNCRITYKWKNYIYFLKKRNFRVSFKDYLENKIKFLNKEIINILTNQIENFSILVLDKSWLTNEYINNFEEKQLDKNILLFNKTPVLIEVNNNHVLQIFSILPNYENLCYKVKYNKDNTLMNKKIEKENQLLSLVNKHFKTKVTKDTMVETLQTYLKDSSELLKNVIMKF